MAKGVSIPPELVASRGFHGSRSDIVDKVLPTATTGAKKSYIRSSDEDTYFLPAPEGTSERPNSERTAWSWARYAGIEYGGRPRVYVTEPHPSQHIDKNAVYMPHGSTFSHMTRFNLDEGERVAPEQTVKDTIWIPPVDEGYSHVQGTLPHINWEQFGGSNWEAFKKPQGLED